MTSFSSIPKIAFCVVISLSVIASCAFAGEGPGTGNMFASSLKALGALVLVLAIILLVAWLAKRYLHVIPQGMNKGDAIKVIAFKVIGPKKTVHLLEVEGQKILIGSTEAGITLLKELSSGTQRKT